MHLSPLRYPGSKRFLLRYLHKIIVFNKLNPDILVEPFIGGGNVSLYLLKNKIIKKVIAADKDKLVYSFWYTLFHNPNLLVNFIKRVNININNFKKYKKAIKYPEDYSIEYLAKACLFLNRTSFSGILTENAGPIGGYKQESKYKINCRFNKITIANKIKELSKYRDKIIVLPYDWNNTLEYVARYIKNRKKPTKAIFYFDPPFYKKGKELYNCYFDNNHHKELSNKLLNLRHDWILSYDNVPEIKKLYSKNKHNKMHIKVPYSINSHSKRIKKELIITPLNLPNMEEL